MISSSNTRRPFSVVNPNIPQKQELTCSARKEGTGNYQHITPPPKPVLGRFPNGVTPPKSFMCTPPMRTDDEELSSPAESTPAPPSDSSDSPGAGCRLRYSPVGGGELEQKYLLPAQSDRHAGKLTVVFDLDETLVSNRNAGVTTATPRHYLMHMFHILRDLAEIVLWTASTEETGKHVLRQIDPNGEFFHHVIYRTNKWFTEGTHTKDLSLLGRSMDRVIIVENTPNCCKLNQQNAIMVEDFTGDLMDRDRTLLGVATIVTGAADAVSRGIGVPAYLRNHSTLPCSVLDTYELGLPLAFMAVPKEQAISLANQMDPLLRPPLGIYYYVKKD